MKRQYDFSQGVRGKFHRPGAVLRLPVYLDPKLRARLERIAERSGKEVGDLVNQWMLKEADLVEEAT